MNWTAAAALASRQRGVVTLEQLGRLGISPPSIRWAVDSGKLTRIFRGAYRYSMAPQTWEQRAMAALLVGGAGACLSHQTAARVWKLHCAEGRGVGEIHLSVPRGSSVRLAKGFVVHRPKRTFVPYSIGGIGVTRLARTLVDIAGDLDPHELEQTLDAAHLRQRRLQAWLTEEVVGLVPRSHPGLGRLLELLRVRQGVGTESFLETRIRQQLRKRGIKEDRLQHEVSDEQGVIMRVDFAWVDERIVVHGDGYLWHGDRKQFDLDAAQRSRLAAAGWAWLSVTAKSVEEELWLKQLERLLKKRAPQLEFFSSLG